MDSNRVIIVVDMLRGFLEPGYPLYCGDESRKIIPLIKNYILREKVPNLFLCDSHTEDDNELRLFGKHCMAGTKESEIVPELMDGVDGIYFDKEYYSGWTNPEFEQCMMEKVGTDATLIFMGVCTDICVLHNVADAYFHGFEKLVVPSYCVASFDQKNHEMALEWMKKQFGVIVE